MSSTQVELSDLGTRFAEVLALAESGADVVLTEQQIPRARLVPLGSSQRIAGLHPGAIQTSDDFDEPLPDGSWQHKPVLKGRCW
jgi:antitoxin (DNA-binding transcriptional repressor) of toxin-antitoxin stability system